MLLSRCSKTFFVFLSLLLLLTLPHTLSLAEKTTISTVRVDFLVDNAVFTQDCQYLSQFWLDYVYTKGGIADGTFNVTVNTIVDAFNNTNIVQIAQKIVDSNATDVVIIVAADVQVQLATVYFERAKIPVVIPSAPSLTVYQCDERLLPPCTKPNTRRFQYAHGLSSPSNKYLDPFIGLLKIKKAKTLALVYPSTLYFYKEVAEGVHSMALDNKIDIVFEYVHEYPTASETSIQYVTNQLKNTNPDAVIMLWNCDLFLLNFKKQDYTPKAIAANRCIDFVHPNTIETQGSNSILTHVCSASQWDYHLTGVDYTETFNSIVSQFASLSNTSPIEFYNQYTARFGHSPDYSMASVMAAFEFLEAGVTMYNDMYLSTSNYSTANIINRDRLNQQMKLLYAPSFYGLLSTNRFGYNQQKAMVLLQRSAEQNNEVISPLSAATADFVYPMPTWKERVYIHSMFSHNEEKILIILIAILGFAIFTILGLFLYKRKSKYIRATSLHFSVLMAFGALSGILSILAWPIENNNATCLSRPWVWAGSFQLFMAPLIAKNYRIAAIFNTKKLNLNKYGDNIVALHSCLVASPQLLILIVWAFVSPLQIVVKIPDSLRPVYNFADCDSEWANTFTWLSLSYSGLCLLIGCLLAYKVRSSYEILNDAKSIANSIYIFTLTSMIIVAVQIGIGNVDQIKLVFIIRSVGVLIAYCATFCILLVPRVISAMTETYWHVSSSMTNNTRPNLNQANTNNII